MAYSPIALTVPQYHVGGVPASGYVLKAYQAGTSTLLQMATDSGGLTLVNTVTLNSEGYPASSAGNVFIPHVNAAYKLALYPSSVAAAANSGAVWSIDNLSPPSVSGNIDISGNTISSTNTNGDITIDPNGSGEINLNAVTNVTTLEAQTVDTQSLELNNVAVTSTAAELNILDGVTATASELNKTDDSEAAIASYVSGMRIYINTDGGAATGFDIDTNVTENTFESVGPTGSSATNIWASMDVIPAAARIAILTLNWNATAATNCLLQLWVRQTGSVATATDANQVAEMAAGSTQSDFSQLIFVPLDSSRRFDVTWNQTGASGQDIDVYLFGFIL